MKCEVCGKGLKSPGSRTLYRVNGIGVVPAIWRCDEHLTAEQKAAIDPQVQDIVNIIENGNRKSN